MGFGYKTLPRWLRKRRGASKIKYSEVVSSSGDTPVPIEPSTYLHRFYSAREGGVAKVSPVYKNDSDTVEDKNGVFTILDQGIEESKVNLTYIGAVTGKVQKTRTSDNRYANWAVEVDVASTVNISSLSGEKTIDNFSTNNSRVLLKNQTNGAQNGIFITSPGAWTRATDADTSAKVVGLTVYVANGTIYGDTAWEQTQPNPVLGTDSLSFSETTEYPYPKWHNVDGRFVQIVNSGLGQRFETNPGVSYAGAVTIFYLIRLNPGQANEYDFNVSNGFTMRDRSSNGNFEVGMVGNALAFGNTIRLHSADYFGKWLLIVAERVEATPGSGTFNRMRVNVNGTWWNEGELLATGTTPITEHVWGGNSHMSHNSFAASGIYHGAFSQEMYDNFRAYCEYYHGEIGEYSANEPRINFDAGDGALSWQTADKSINGPAHTFYSPHGDTEGATEVRLYGSNSATVTTAIENRTYIATKTVGVDANPYKFIRGTDFGTPGEPATQTDVQYWLEYIAVDSTDRRQRIASITQNIRDNQA